MSSGNKTVFTLSRIHREALARLADRLAHKGTAMSVHAAEAVQLLLSPDDRVELTHLQAVTVVAGVYAESARLSSVVSRGVTLMPRQQISLDACSAATEQYASQDPIGQIRTSDPDGPKPPRKLGVVSDD